MVLTQQQTDLLHAAVELALETWDKGVGDNGEALDRVVDKILSASHGPNELVIQAWDPKYGHCYECGAPAAYRLTGPNYDDGEAWLRCSTCAALAAAEDGDSITYLFREDFQLMPVEPTNPTQD